jgi:hypothetical protein
MSVPDKHIKKLWQAIRYNVEAGIKMPVSKTPDERFLVNMHRHHYDAVTW